MSNTIRWILAIVLILVGSGVSIFIVFGGAFATVACQIIPPEWIYYILLISGVTTLSAAVIPAAMLIRKARGGRILLVLVVGVIISCIGYSSYLALLGKIC